MPLNFSLLLAPLLPGFHFPGSACCAASLGASHHWVLGHWAAQASSSGHHPLFLPRTSHPILAPGSGLGSPAHLPSYLLRHSCPEVHLQPLYSTRFFSGRECWPFPCPCRPSPPPALLTCCPPKCWTLEGLSSGTASSHRPSPKAPGAETWINPAHGQGEPKHCCSAQTHQKPSSLSTWSSWKWCITLSNHWALPTPTWPPVLYIPAQETPRKESEYWNVTEILFLFNQPTIYPLCSQHRIISEMQARILYLLCLVHKHFLELQVKVAT